MLDLLRYGSFEMRHLRLMLAVAEERTLTRAASRLRLTTSALSHQLRQLESLAGVAMFHRDGRSMRTTRAGDTLVAAARNALEAVQDAEARLRGDGLEPEVIRLCTHCYTGYAWLPSIIAAFARGHSDVEVRLSVEATQNPFAALLERKLDLVLTLHRPSNGNFMVQPLFHDELVLLVPPTHRLANQSWVSLSEFRTEHLILHPENIEESLFFSEHLAPAGIRPKRFTGVMLTEAIVEMVKAGLGVTVLPRWTAARLLGSNGALRGTRISRRGVSIRWYSVTRKKRDNALALAALIKEIRTQMLRRTKSTRASCPTSMLAMNAKKDVGVARATPNSIRRTRAASELPAKKA